jgi:hypothetical protein
LIDAFAIESDVFKVGSSSCIEYTFPRASVGGELKHLKRLLALTASIPKDELVGLACVCVETSGIEARTPNGDVHIERASRVKLMWSPACHPEKIWLAVDSDSGAVAHCGIDGTDMTRAFEAAKSMRKQRQLARHLWSVAKAKAAEAKAKAAEAKAKAAEAKAKAAEAKAAAKRVCVNCDRESEGGKFQVCMGCKSARYCSRACQIAHWKAFHRHVCVSPSE